MSSSRGLRDLARAAGIDADYKSWRGQPVSASDESVHQALRTLAADLGVDIVSLPLPPPLPPRRGR